MQLMTHVIPSLEQLRKEGESGRKIITKYTRYGTLILATVQAVGIAIALQNQSAGGSNLVFFDRTRLCPDRRRHTGDRHHVPDVAR